MSHPDLARIGASRYVRLTTFRGDGTPVPTPVWVTLDGDRLYVYTQATSGKVARLRANARVAIAPSDWRGRSSAPDVPGQARLLDPEQSIAARRRLIAKYKGEYRLFQVVGDLSNKLRRKPKPPEVGIEIELLPTDPA